MRKVVEGSQAIAEVIRNLKVGVVSAYPITPQTHIVEELGKMKADGRADFEYLQADSEFAAISIVLGAVLAGERAYTATNSQGLLLMTEVLFNIAGMRLPVVVTCTNRAVSAPINIWNDQQDVMTIRDAGWILLFAETNQEAVDLHSVAFKIAQKLRIPVMVNMDGFILTHSFEAVEIPEEKSLNAFLNLKPTNYLETRNPKTLGAFATPSDYWEFRKDLHEDLAGSKEEIKSVLKEYKDMTGRDYASGLIEYTGKKDAKTVIVTLGSVVGTVKSWAEKNKEVELGILKIRSLRPFPDKEVLEKLKKAERVVVLDKSISLSKEGVLAIEVRSVLGAANIGDKVESVVGGLGGKDIREEEIGKIVLEKQAKDKVTFI
jgi:pyruvate ferredoxin oxidoreductase alpha subunit